MVTSKDDSPQKAWLLVAVLGVAGVGIASAFLPDLWVSLAYKERAIAHSSMVYLQKRTKWIPGREVLLPDQLCSACGEPLFDHEGCLTNRISECEWVILNTKRGGEICAGSSNLVRPGAPIGDDFRCTCPHPSHRDE